VPCNAALLAALAIAGLLWSRRVRGAARDDTWGCGYAAPTCRMQYTSSSFAQMLVRLFAWVLRPRVHKPENLPLFPPKNGFHSDVPDPVLDEAVLPTFRLGAWLISWVRVFQQGNVQAYLLYVFVALITLLLWR
jgi:hydrogenase-4 component B